MTNIHLLLCRHHRTAWHPKHRRHKPLNHWYTWQIYTYLSAGITKQHGILNIGYTWTTQPLIHMIIVHLLLSYGLPSIGIILSNTTNWYTCIYTVDLNKFKDQVILKQSWKWKLKAMLIWSYQLFYWKAKSYTQFCWNSIHIHYIVIHSKVYEWKLRHL